MGRPRQTQWLRTAAQYVLGAIFWAIAVSQVAALYGQPAEQENKTPPGQMKGSVEVPSGNADEVAVVWTRSESAVSSSKGEISSQTGVALVGHGATFEAKGLEDGIYTICPQARGGDLLNPCLWDKPLRVEIRDGKVVGGESLKLALKEGSRLRLVFDDPDNVLASADNPAGKAVMQVGVWSSSGRYIPLRATGLTAVRQVFEVVVPAATRIRMHLQVMGGGVLESHRGAGDEVVSDPSNANGFDVDSAKFGLKVLRFVVKPSATP